MAEASGAKGSTITDRDSVKSTEKLIDNEKKTTTNDQSTEQKFNIGSPQPSSTNENSSTQSPLPKAAPGGPSTNKKAATIIWYICVCLLFMIAFLCLILSVLYYVSGSSSDQVIKIYGIVASSVLAVVTFFVVFIDCCYDGRLTEYEEETLDNMLLDAAERRQRRAEERRERQKQQKKEQKTKMVVEPDGKVRSAFLPNHQGPLSPSKPHKHPYFHWIPHHHHHGNAQHVYHSHLPVQSYPNTSQNGQFFCPICHKNHASTEEENNRNDIAVDTSDKFEPISKRQKVVQKKTTEAQTAPIKIDTDHGTQTARVEETQTSTAELSGIPSNVTEIIHETTILKAPRSLLPTLRKSLARQDKELAINAAITDSSNSRLETH